MPRQADKANQVIGTFYSSLSVFSSVSSKESAMRHMRHIQKMHKMQKGFTMVELIVVIIILGILAAVALPRFTNLQRDARIAKLNAARGAVASASAQVHGAAVARQGQVQPACPANGVVPNVNAAGTGTICTENGTINVALLYPTANLPGIVATAGLVQGTGAPNAAALAAEGYGTIGGGNTAGSVLTVTVPGGAAAATCSFTYTAPTTLGAAAVVGAINNAGC
jgi:MSHA pilin protein MshA